MNYRLNKIYYPEQPSESGAQSGEESISEAIILAGGLGTRLRSAVPDLPKCMAPVGGKPFLSQSPGRFGKIVLFSAAERHLRLAAFVKSDAFKAAARTTRWKVAPL